MKNVIWTLLALVLVSFSLQAEVTQEQVIEAIKKQGIEIRNLKRHERDASSPMPNSYKERWSFEDVELNNGKGGQFFICTKKRYCEAIYKYFESWLHLAGPYLYHNKDGTLVAQMNSGLTPEQAEKYESIFYKLN